MKKNVSILLAVIATAVALTGCNGKTTTSSTSNSSSSSNTSSDYNSSSISGNGSLDSNSNESGSDTLTPFPGDDDSNDESFPTAAETLIFPNTRAGEIAKAAVSAYADSWSGMLYIPNDPEEIKIIFYNFDLSLCEDSCLVTDMTGISAQEVILAKAKAGSEEELDAWFDSYFEYLHSPDNFLYPAGGVSVSGSVKGTTSDGYLYIVVHENGAEIADAMVK